jgi:hypothetical protein
MGAHIWESAISYSPKRGAGQPPGREVWSYRDSVPTSSSCGGIELSSTRSSNCASDVYVCHFRRGLRLKSIPSSARLTLLREHMSQSVFPWLV